MENNRTYGKIVFMSEIEDLVCGINVKLIGDRSAVAVGACEHTESLLGVAALLSVLQKLILASVIGVDRLGHRKLLVPELLISFLLAAPLVFEVFFNRIYI